MDYFFGTKDEDKKIQPDPEADELDEFIQLFERLSPEQKSFILSSMKGILAER